MHVDGHLDDAGILAALRHLEPGKPFRSAYQYQNLMYLVAGLVLKRVSGERCEDFVRARILPPLGVAAASGASTTAGGWSGYNGDLRLLPDHGSGVMVLTNGRDPGCAPLTNTAPDHLLGLEPLL